MSTIEVRIGGAEVGWSDAAIAAGAALAASALTGIFSTIQSNKSLKQNSRDLERTFTHESGEARNHRNQERLQAAYIRVLEYVYWSKHTNLVRVTVVDRASQAVQAARNPKLMTYSGLTDNERAAFLKAGLTEEEREILLAGPTFKDNSTMHALVAAFASDSVRSAFEILLSSQKEVARLCADIEGLLVYERKPVPSDAELSDVRDAAIQLINVSFATFQKGIELPGALELFNSSANKIEALVRTELNNLEAVRVTNLSRSEES